MTFVCELIRPMQRTTGLWMLASLFVGCGVTDDKDYRLPVHPAQGTVTFKGSPVAKATIRLHPVDPAVIQLPPGKEGPAILLTSETDDQGKFSMSTYLADDGVPAGEYIVTLTPPASGPDVENSDNVPARPEKGNRLIPQKYLDPKTSPLRIKVSAELSAFPLDLTP